MGKINFVAFFAGKSGECEARTADPDKNDPKDDQTERKEVKIAKSSLPALL